MIEIILSVLGFIEVTFGAWAVWVTLSINKLDKEVSLNDQKDISVIEEIGKMNGKLDSIQTEMKAIHLALVRNGIEVE